MRKNSPDIAFASLKNSTDFSLTYYLIIGNLLGIFPQKLDGVVKSY
ncbi:MAG: hypothetical protein WC460_00205 [Patescibacteria group bacterium]